MQTSDWIVTKDFSSNFFGSTIAEFTLVKILNSSATRKSYPYDDSPYETTPCRTCFSQNGLIMSWSSAILRIQRSLLIAIALPCAAVAPGAARPKPDLPTKVLLDFLLLCPVLSY